MYYPGVDLPSNSILSLNFTTNVSGIVFNNASMNAATYRPTVTTSPLNSYLVNITLSAFGAQIYANTSFMFNFTFTAPGRVAFYDALATANVSSNGVLYEVLNGPLEINVNTAIVEAFSITASVPKTGAPTSYTFKFFIDVSIGKYFFLGVTLPPDVGFSTSPNPSCNPNCNYTSTTTPNTTIWINASINTDGANTYSITLNGFTNPRAIGQTGTFNFTITTEVNGNQVITGNGSVFISLPNLATVYFSPDYSAYRSNSLPI
jgi:hypothetical protein